MENLKKEHGAREKLKRSREHRKMKKEQGKGKTGAKDKKLKGAGSKRGNCKRSRERGPPLTEAHLSYTLPQKKRRFLKVAFLLGKTKLT